MTPLRILFLSNYLPPQAVGGAEICAWQEMCGLQARGHAVRGLTLDWPGVAPTAGTEPGPGDPPVVRVRAAGYHGPPLEFRRDPGLESAFSLMLRELTPDLVHFHNLQGVTLRLVSLARRAGALAVLTVHDAWGVCPNGLLLRPDDSRCPGSKAVACVPCFQATRNRKLSPRRRALMVVRNWRVRRALGRLDCYVFPSRHHLELHARAGFPRERARVLPNPSGSGVGDPPPLPCSTGTGPLRLLFLGSLARHKGIDVLLAALGRIPTVAASLAIHGRADQASLEQIRTMAREYGLDGLVEHRGTLPYAGTTDAIRNADVVVVPSLCAENSPKTIIDALALGRPVVATDLGGVPELVQDGHNGWLVQPGDVSGLAKALGSLAGDRVTVLRMGAAGPASVSDHTEMAHLAGLESIYGETLAARDAGHRKAPPWAR